ncbi:hypothetical protein [Paenibacillus lentus]|uniref:Rho termination factor N-terminal domain-containing protein n=1 Tax=Paenibacillus lentus TaxID=1338368 RepID=A0A3Q8S395_9BACL|nr:hypothetical protein [Paenibacillus lentus]AZK44780.1 hypothetical protein EIM92_00030 [Paenibacillus lentus]
MAKVIAPNKQYNGISAGVPFVNGVGETTDPYLITWFEDRGYVVEHDEIEEDSKASSEFDDMTIDEIEENSEISSELNDMTIDELKTYAEKHKIDIGQSTSQKGIIKKILAAKEAE